MHFIKDPDAVLDYAMAWSQWLETGETIATSTWIVPSGLTKGADAKTTTKTTVWLSGGTAGQTYRVTNRITTTLGRTEDRSILVQVQDR